MFHPREFDCSSNTDGATIVVDTRSGDRRIFVHPPLHLPSAPRRPEMFQFPQVHMETDTESVGPDNLYDQEFENEYDDAMVGDHLEQQEQQEITTAHERRLFSTPCGQTYWVDEKFYLYTNETVERPIGYWCDQDQSVYIDDNIWDNSDDDDDDEYDVPPTPPPVYEESNSLIGSPASMDTNSDDEVDGEIIIMGGL